MQVHFKIGEIADMFDISVRALHLYDKMQLFTPEYIDESTGYRYYSADQVQKLNTILSFKKIGFSLTEIKILFDNNLNAMELLNMLKNKANYFQQQIDIASFNIENIQKMMKSIEESANIKAKNELTEEEKAKRMSRLVCLENLKLENLLSEILWL
jgi:DNA-binding transcriptional MerR regulator